jgi:predicted TIM-barrel fold metal-dependent hydrolase
MDRHYRNPRFVGAKIHCQYSRKDTATAEIAALLHEIARRGKPVKIHNDGPGWEQALIDACRRDPDLTIIIAHGGLGQPSVEGARAAAETENIYLEFASSFPELPVVREAVRLAGPDRILFGTDVPLLNPAFVIGTYHDAGLLTPDNRATMTLGTRKLFES